jgi:hypothetical protein
MKTFYDFMKASYDYQDLKDIAENGCVNVAPGGLIYYHETIAMYDKFSDELHDKLDEWINEIGETPDFIVKELGNATGFKNAMVWFVAEQYANELYQTIDCAEEA